MLRSLKLLTLRAADTLGVFSALLDSAWRRRRLLILCYHGSALEDEHLWDPSLYMPPGLIRERFVALRVYGCAVLPLGEALERLRAGTLPPRSVSITFDDGTYDFYRLAWPLLREFGYPATVYLTTYYSQWNRPVFDPMCSYLLWKARGSRLDLPEALGAPDEGTTADTAGRVLSYARRNLLSAHQKDELLVDMAARLGIDYGAICARRILHLMRPDEVAEVARSGIDIQLHTHRHRVPRVREQFVNEIEENRAHIATAVPETRRHFCYPCGLHLPEFPAWLKACGVVSATTCEIGLASRSSDPLLLPRLVDSSTLTPIEYSGWLSGFASVLPSRSCGMCEGQSLE